MDRTPSVAIDLTEFRAGWRIVMVALLGLAVSANVAMLYGFGAMVIPLQTAFGWSRGELQPAIGFLFGGAVVGAQIVSWLNERVGMKRMTMVSALGLSVTFALIPLLIGRSVVWFYLLCGLLPVAGMGFQHITWTTLVNLWFQRNRGLALALMLSGTGLSAAVMPSIVTWAVGRWNWQAPFFVMAVLPLVVLPLIARWMALPAAVAAARRADVPAAAALPGLSFREGLRSPRFWMVNLALGLAVTGMVVMVSNTVPLLRDKGLSAVDASRVFGSFGLALIAGRITVGYLVDRLWAPGVAAVAMAAPAFGCLLLSAIGAERQGLLALGSVLVGIGAGAEFDIAAFLVARYCGMRQYGRLFAVHIGVTTIASAVAPGLFGLLYTATGSYASMLAICGTGFLVGALLLLSLGRYPDFTRLQPPAPLGEPIGV